MKKVSRPKIKREKKRADKIKKLIAVYTELYKSFSGKVSVTDLEVAGYSYDQVRYYFGNIKQLDKEMNLYGFPVGPVTLMDEVGIDVGSHIAANLAQVWPDRLGGDTSLLNDMVQFPKRHGWKFK